MGYHYLTSWTACPSLSYVSWFNKRFSRSERIPSHKNLQRVNPAISWLSERLSSHKNLQRLNPAISFSGMSVLFGPSERRPSPCQVFTLVLRCAFHNVSNLYHAAEGAVELHPWLLSPNFLPYHSAMLIATIELTNKEIKARLRIPGKVTEELRARQADLSPSSYLACKTKHSS